MKLDSSLAAIVTGGASGLGEATARMLAGQGVKVALLDLNAERGEAIAQEIGGVFALCDVTSEASVDEAFAKARAAHRVARIIVNCAGIAPGRRVVSKKRDTGELIAHDLATFEKAVAINLTGTFRIIAKSVSYTHLDVYKRQAQFGQKRKSALHADHPSHGETESRDDGVEPFSLTCRRPQPASRSG